MSVLIEEQDNLVERIADNLDQKLLALQRALALSAIEITEADIASPDAAQRYLDSNTGLYAAVDRSTFLFTPEAIMLAERPYRANRRGLHAADRAYMRDTISTQQPVISEPFLTNIGDENMVLVVTTPVFAKDGRMIAILTGSLGLTHPGMLGNVAKTVIGKTGYLYIVTADGSLIMHPDRTRLSQKAFAPRANPLFDRALKGYIQARAVVELDRRRRISEGRSVHCSPRSHLAFREPPVTGLRAGGRGGLGVDPVFYAAPRSPYASPCDLHCRRCEDRSIGR